MSIGIRGGKRSLAAMEMNGGEWRLADLMKGRVNREWDNASSFSHLASICDIAMS